VPEGDTIFRAARTLDRALSGRRVTNFETQLPQLARVHEDTPIIGRIVDKVDAAGKWMRMYFSGDLILLTHMRMSGSWHIYRPGEPWKRGRYQMRVAIYTDDFVAVAFQVRIAEFHTPDSLERRRGLQQLGPDVLAPEFDAPAAASRLAAQPDLEVGEALLRQSIVAGMGNIFKSEVCFAARVNPFRLVGSLTREEHLSLMTTARKFLSMNVTESAKDGIVTFTGAGRGLWVYQRRGEPCRHCGDAILSRKQGPDARVTFWCPRCQKPGTDGDFSHF